MSLRHYLAAGALAFTAGAGCVDYTDIRNTTPIEQPAETPQPASGLELEGNIGTLVRHFQEDRDELVAEVGGWQYALSFRQVRRCGDTTCRLMDALVLDMSYDKITEDSYSRMNLVLTDALQESPGEVDLINYMFYRDGRASASTHRPDDGTRDAAQRIYGTVISLFAANIERIMEADEDDLVVFYDVDLTEPMATLIMDANERLRIARLGE